MKLLMSLSTVKINIPGRNGFGRRRQTVRAIGLLVAIFVPLAGLSCTAAAGSDSKRSIPATGCFVRLKDQAQVPARDSGVLAEIHAELGDHVEASDLLATLQDTEAKLTLKLAEIDLAVAEKRRSESVAVEIAAAAVAAAEQLQQHAKIGLKIAQKVAQSDIEIRQATAAATLANDALVRAQNSRREFTSSISDLELAKLQFENDKSVMDVEQARYNQSVEELRSSSSAALAEQQNVAVRQRTLELAEARMEMDVASLSVDRMRKAVEVAAEKLARRQLRSPLRGIIVERLRHKGEWVEAGETVMRIIRLDQLLVEGYVESGLVNQSTRGRKVMIQVTGRGRATTLPGRIIFVSPEVDSLNGQVQVKAEVENPDLLLQPGQPVDMVILAE
ncbi:MAG: HlyD family efflux transporter periplasmic adaptor subunit [Fuerstiella sp.]